MESNLNINIKDYNGPLDVLLELVHKNKYDLKNLPILQLCNQYISFIEDLKKVNIEVASEYLLMASIMVFLKSKFLVNKDKELKKVTKILTNRLTILEMVHKNTKLLFELPQFKQQFTCDYKNKLKVENNFIIKDKLIDLLKAYAQIHKRNQQYTLKFSPLNYLLLKMVKMLFQKKYFQIQTGFLLKA